MVRLLRRAWMRLTSYSKDRCPLCGAKTEGSARPKGGETIYVCSNRHTWTLRKVLYPVR